MVLIHPVACGKQTQIFCKKSDAARQYVNRWLPIVAAAQLTKKKEKEKELLLRWIDVAEYQ